MTLIFNDMKWSKKYNAYINLWDIDDKYVFSLDNLREISEKISNYLINQDNYSNKHHLKINDVEYYIYIDNECYIEYFHGKHLSDTSIYTIHIPEKLKSKSEIYDVILLLLCKYDFNYNFEYLI